MTTPSLDLRPSAPSRPRFRYLTDVLSRIRFDLGRALRPDRSAALIAAATTCARCREVGACELWIAEHEEGADNPPPDFCPNVAMMRSGRPG